jgi:predicted O-methyltransferase YrrM
MNMGCFLKRFPEILMNDRQDGQFETLNILIGGSTSARIGKLLNFAVSQMSDGECYVETGVFNGGTLISANFRNGRPAFGIDPYDGMVERADPSPVRDKARLMIGVMGEGAKLIEKDFRVVTKDDLGGLPVAVSFIDAMHTYKDVTENLVWLEPLLAKDALIVFDDINYGGVEGAIHDWFGSHRENYELTALIKPFYQDLGNLWTFGDRFLNNGVAVLRYHKDPLAKGVFQFGEK